MKGSGMRDILNDLEAGKQLSDPDPVRRAQIQMRAPAVKRFYETATAEPEADWSTPARAYAPSAMEAIQADRTGGQTSGLRPIRPREKRRASAGRGR